MRKFKSLLMMAVLLIVAVSCGKKYEVTLSPTDYEFNPQGGEMTLEITTEGDWNLDNCPEWINVSATSGSKSASVVLTAQPNLSDAQREAAVQVSTSTNDARLTLKQGFVTEDFIRLSMDSISVGYEGAEFELTVYSNCDWSLSPSSHLDWITVNPTSGNGTQTVKITVSENVSASEVSARNATLLFAGGNLIVPFRIFQSDGSEVAVRVDPRTLRFAAEGESQQLNVTCAANWTVSVSVPWLKVNVESGSGNGQVTVTAECNENFQARLGAVIFTSNAQQNTVVSVSQDAAIDPHYLNVSPLQVNFEKQGGRTEITIACDGQWKVDCPEHWISLSAQDGEGDGTFEIIAEENVLNVSRNTEVFVVSGNLEERIRVFQEAGDQAPYVSLNVDVINADAVGDVFPVEVSSNVAWTVRGSSWAQPIQNSGEGDGTFSLRVDTNYDMAPRSCTVRVSTAQGASASFEVVQSGYVYTLSTGVTEITAPAEGLKTEIPVFANQNWIVSKGASWILYDPVSGTNDGAFTIVVDPNVFPRDRSAEIYVTGEKDGLVIIQVNQPHAK